MRLVKCNRSEIGKIYTIKKTERLMILEEFVNSEMDCAKLEGWTNHSASACAASMNQSIKRYNMSSIRACSRGNNVYLVKNV